MLIRFYSKIRKRIVGSGIGKLLYHSDVAAGKRIDLDALFSSHFIDMTEFFDRSARQVLKRHGIVKISRHHLEKGLLSEGIRNSLEYKHCRFFSFFINRHVLTVDILLGLFGSMTGI